jgi:2-dehydro-3-deoxygalactonokinase
MASGKLLICVDMGTTRTRAWLVRDHELYAQAFGDFGVRNVAGGQTGLWLRERLAELLRQVVDKASEKPVAVLAAGMITSGQGLRDVPQVQVPASAPDLAVRLCIDEMAISDEFSLPLLLFPGVRTGELGSTPMGALQMDLMRGEETLCIGLLSRQRLLADGVLLSLGSHWKLIWTDSQGRIARSRTTLTGEMIHAAQTHTLLASALPQMAPTYLNPEWLDMGFKEARQSGLSRALFCVRLLQLSKQGTEGDRLAFLYGAFLQAELSHMTVFEPTRKELLLVGSECLTATWKTYGERAGIRCSVVSEMERQEAYLDGLLSLFELSASGSNEKTI